MRYVAQLLFAAAAVVGAVLWWPKTKSLTDVPPIAEGQPALVAVVYHPPILFGVLVLVTAAGVLTVLGIAGLRRRRSLSHH